MVVINNRLIFVETFKQNKMKNLKQIIQLTNAASDLLEVAEQSNKKYESLLKYNVEVAAPNDFTPHSDSKIEFQAKVTAKVMNAYFRVINQIKTFES